MQSPVFQTATGQTVVKSFRTLANTNFTAAATEIGKRVGAHPVVDEPADLVTLTDATPLDFARTAAGAIYQLKAVPPTTLSNWVEQVDAEVVDEAVATATGRSAALALVFGG